MKLAKVTANEPTERTAITMKLSTHTLLKKYQDLYKATHGDEIPFNLMIETMVLDYMRDDKAFQKSLTQNKNAEKPTDAKAE